MQFIEKVKSGGWLFDDLLPPFANTLDRSPRTGALNIRALPIYVKTLAHYGILKPDEIAKAIDQGAFNGSLPLTAESAFVWTALSRAVSPAAAAASLGPEQTETLRRAWTELSTVHAATGAEFAKAVTALVPLEAESFGAASTPHLFGCIFVTEKWVHLPFQDRMISLVHELAHQELFLINLTDRLVNASADYSLVHAPFQETERPPIARLHAAHALFRMDQFRQITGWEDLETKRLLLETCRTFRDEELTQFSKQMVQSVYTS